MTSHVRLVGRTPGVGKVVLVTGVTTALGWHVAQAAAEQGMFVIATDPFPPATLPPNVTFIRGDVYTMGFADDLFAVFRFAYVYHMQVRRGSLRACGVRGGQAVACPKWLSLPRPVVTTPYRRELPLLLLAVDPAPHTC